MIALARTSRHGVQAEQVRSSTAAMRSPTRVEPGGIKLDTTKSEDVKRSNARRRERPEDGPQGVGGLERALKEAVECEVIDRMLCTVKLQPVPKGPAAFYDFDQYERLIEVARAEAGNR